MRKIVLLFVSLFLLGACTQKTIETKQTENLSKFEKEIKQYEEVLSQSGCKAGENYYLWLSADYKYTHQYQKAIDILNQLANCYPGAYKEKTIKAKLLLNNAGVIYEDWAYYLKQKWDQNYKKKYAKAKESFKALIKFFSGTKLLTKEEVESYKERMKRY